MEIPFEGLTHVGRRNHVLDESPDRHEKRHFGETSATMRLCGLLLNYFGHLFLPPIYIIALLHGFKWFKALSDTK